MPSKPITLRTKILTKVTILAIRDEWSGGTISYTDANGTARSATLSKTSYEVKPGSTVKIYLGGSQKMDGLFVLTNSESAVSSLSESGATGGWMMFSDRKWHRGISFTMPTHDVKVGLYNFCRDGIEGGPSYCEDMCYARGYEPNSNPGELEDWDDDYTGIRYGTTYAD